MHILNILILLENLALVMLALILTVKLIQYYRIEEKTPNDFRYGEVYLSEKKKINGVINALYIMYGVSIAMLLLYPETHFVIIFMLVLAKIQQVVLRMHDSIIIIMERMMAEITRISKAKTIDELQHKKQE